MTQIQTSSNDEALRSLGHRLKQERLNRDWTQRDLADLAGVGLRTVRGVEAGASASMDTWISLLRALGRLNQLDQFLPEPPASPIQLAKLKGKQRRRASGGRRPDGLLVDEPRTGWSWGDEEAADDAG